MSEQNLELLFESHKHLMLWLLEGGLVIDKHGLGDIYKLNEKGFLFNITRNMTDDSLYFSGYKHYIPYVAE